MIVETVVLCPPLPGPAGVIDRDALAAALLAGGQATSVPRIAAPGPGQDRQARCAGWLAQVALALTAARVRGPVLPVLTGAAGALAPAFGQSQRAVPRTVAGYLLLDAAPPDAGLPTADLPVPDWPDAPVAALLSPAAGSSDLRGLARLRDWRVIDLPDLEPATVAAAIIAHIAI